MKRASRIMQLRPSGNYFFAGLLDGHVLWNVSTHALRPGPFHPVGNHTLNLRMMIDRIGLMARTEIKNSSAAAHPAIASAKNFPTLEPRHKHLLVGHRNAKRLTIHL